MNKEVVVIPAEKVQEKSGKQKGILRVAAYCRVSTDEEKQLGSFENQMEYYTRMIAEKRDWELVKIYSDEGISGTSTKSRKGFKEMITDCEAGRIDFIVTKSISRFARNTQDSLNYTRKLKDMGIGIHFEKEGINTLESSGELLLTLFSCFAQEESRSISENTAWGIRSKFQKGEPHLNAEILLGYDKDENGRLVINEAQAKVVRRIYRSYLEGYSLNAIARALNADAIPGVRGEPNWCAVTISRILENEKYKGALLMQKTFTVNYLTKKNLRNTGQLNQYYIEKNHTPIIPPEEWEAVQQETARRKAFRTAHHLRGLSSSGGSPFYARLFCSTCVTKLQRIYKKGVERPYWQCITCRQKTLEERLRSAFCAAFNRLVEERTERSGRWTRMMQEGRALEKLRAKQILAITAEGPIPFEVPHLTQAILQEVWLSPDGALRFVFLSGDEIQIPPSDEKNN